MKKLLLYLFLFISILSFGQSSRYRVKNNTKFGWTQKMVPVKMYSDSTWDAVLFKEDIPTFANGFWGLLGNTLNSNSKFLGSIDNRSFRIRTNNIERLVIDTFAVANFKLNTNLFIDQTAGINSISPKKFSFQPWVFLNSYPSLYLGQHIESATNFFAIADTTLTKVNGPQTLYLGQGGSNGLQIQMLENNGNTGTTLAASGHYFFTSGAATNTVNANQFIPLVVYPAHTYSLGGGIVPTAYLIETIAPNIKATTATTITEWATQNFPNPIFSTNITHTRVFGVQTNTDVSIGGRTIIGLTGTVPTATLDVRGNAIISSSLQVNGIVDTGSLTTAGTGSIGSTFTVTGASVFTGGITTPTVYGGSAPSGTLNLFSTSNATKGIINIGSGAGTVIIQNATSLGKATVPNATLDVAGTLSVSSTVTFASTMQLGTANAVLTGGNTGTVAVVSDNLFNFQFGWSVQNPADATTYYLSSANLFNGNGAGAIRYVLPVACTMIGYSFSNINLTTNATNEASTLRIRKNNTTNTDLSTTITFSATNVTSDFTKNISFAAGDDFSAALITPTWPITNPLGSCMNIVYYFKRQ